MDIGVEKQVSRLPSISSPILRLFPHLSRQVAPRSHQSKKTIDTARTNEFSFSSGDVYRTLVVFLQTLSLDPLLLLSAPVPAPRPRPLLSVTFAFIVVLLLSF